MSIKVAVRVRPFNQREIALNAKCCIKMVRAAQNGKLTRLEWTHDFNR